VIVL
jgi:hypothetical protein